MVPFSDSSAQEGESAESFPWTRFDVLCASYQYKVGRERFPFRGTACELDRVTYVESEDLELMKCRKGLLERDGPRGQSLSFLRAHRLSRPLSWVNWPGWTGHGCLVVENRL